MAVTGCGEVTDRRRSDVVGIDLHLIKSVEPAVLAGVLERIVRMLAPTEDGQGEG